MYALTLHDKPWIRAKEVYMGSLEYRKKTTKIAHIVTAHVGGENYTHKCRLNKVLAKNTLINWSFDSRKDHYYINEEGTYEMVFASQKPKAKTSRKYCCNTMFPHIRRELTNKVEEDH